MDIDINIRKNKCIDGLSVLMKERRVRLIVY